LGTTVGDVKARSVKLESPVPAGFWAIDSNKPKVSK